MKLGTTGADVYTGGGTLDFFMGASSDDRMDAYAGDDILIGGAGNDVLRALPAAPPSRRAFCVTARAFKEFADWLNQKTP